MNNLIANWLTLAGLSFNERRKEKGGKKKEPPEIPAAL
jgi:hypothetical protein